MLDKELIKNRFKKSINTYDDNAFIQDLMAKKLIELIKGKKYKNILEIGSYTGVLTKRLAKSNPDFISYTAIDIVQESDVYIKKINKKINFINIDIENYNTDKKFDLIIANASLQWCNNLCGVVERLKFFLEQNGTIAISLFSKDNFYEIKDIFNVGLNYPSVDEIKLMFDDEIKILNEKYELNFKNVFDIFKHLKLTGVNALEKNIFSIKEFKKKIKNYQIKYNNRLTYSPVYIIFQHS